MEEGGEGSTRKRMELRYRCARGIHQPGEPGPGIRSSVRSTRHVTTNPVDDSWTRVSIASGWLLFHRLLRAGNFKFDYKLPALFPPSPLSRLPFRPVPPVFLPPLPPPPPPRHTPSTPCPGRAATLSQRARDPMKNSRSPDCDGIIGRPALFMAFILPKMSVAASLAVERPFVFPPAS